VDFGCLFLLIVHDISEERKKRKFEILTPVMSGKKEKDE